MPSQGTVRVVFNNLGKIAADLGVQGEQIVAATAQAIAAPAQANAPVLTGELRGSITAHSVGPEHWQVTAGTDHALYVEYGTAKHGAAQPYMTPAGEAARPTFVAAMQHIIPGA